MKLSKLEIDIVFTPLTESKSISSLSESVNLRNFNLIVVGPTCSIYFNLALGGFLSITTSSYGILINSFLVVIESITPSVITE